MLLQNMQSRALPHKACQYLTCITGYERDREAIVSPRQFFCHIKQVNPFFWKSVVQSGFPCFDHKDAGFDLTRKINDKVIQ